MAIKTVQIDAATFVPTDDCIVLRSLNGYPFIEMAFPFHEDTPNFRLTISQALHLRDALNELTKVRFLEVTKEDVK